VIRSLPFDASTQRVMMLILLFLASIAVPALAQEPARVKVRVRAEDAPVAEARVTAGRVGAVTDSAGAAVLLLARSPHRLAVAKAGFETASLAITVSGDTTVEVELEAEEDEHEIEALVVTSTRSEQRIEDVPVRVEVLAREEVEEKMMMTPGDVAMMLNETSGLRVASTSPSLGGATVRVQGLRGRYTQVLSDGLPLYGGQSGALGLLQIPPMDLGQVEVIKGAASALYGGSALGGVVNLVSRRPPEEGERELLLNGTTRGGADAVLWTSDQLGERWGYTLLAGAHAQADADLDGDRWDDLPAYRRAVMRPRLFWDDGAGRSIFFTVGGTIEDREGGGDVAEGIPFPEELRTRRMDAGAVGRFLLGGGPLLTVRASAVAQRHRHTFGDVEERDLHRTGFAEAALAGEADAHRWVLGTALQIERYDARDVPRLDYEHVVPSVFAQDEAALSDALSILVSARVDRHGDFGTFASPRVSALLRPAEGWSVRASAGTGYHAPTPFTEETEAIGLTVLVATAEKAERARSASLDVARVAGALELNATLFGSLIDDAVALRPVPGGVELANVEGETRTWGTELLARWKSEPWHLTATHTFVRSSEPEPDGGPERREVPLTPRHQLGFVGMWEAEGRGRAGLELYYTGRQALEDNPYRAESRPFLIVGLLAERRIGRARVFVNAENLLDARQTRWDPLVLPARSPEGRWTTDLWAPAEGRVINAGVRMEL